MEPQALVDRAEVTVQAAVGWLRLLIRRARRRRSPAVRRGVSARRARLHSVATGG